MTGYHLKISLCQLNIHHVQQHVVLVTMKGKDADKRYCCIISIETSYTKLPLDVSQFKIYGHVEEKTQPLSHNLFSIVYY